MRSSDSTDQHSRIDPVLVVIVIAAAVIGALVVSRARNWALMTDELLYTGMARSIASTHLPVAEIFGTPAHINQILFPLLIAPVVSALPMPDAYQWIAAINAALLASAAIPAYLFARRVTASRTAARWVAACAVATPWLAVASKALPDATAYAALMWAAFAIVRTARSSPAPRALKGDLLALLALVVAYLARNQFLMLAGVWPAVVVGVAAAAAVEHGGLRAIPRRLLRLPLERPLPFALLAAVLLLLALTPQWLLGVYSVAATSEYGGPAPQGLFGAFFEHLSVIEVGLAGIPLVLGLPWLLAALGRPRSHRQIDGAITIILLTVAIVLVGSSFDLRFTEFGRVIDRYIFYAVPLLIVAMAGCLTAPPKHPALFFLPAIAAIWLIDASHPYGLDAPLTYAVNHATSVVPIVLIEYQHVAGRIGLSIYTMMLLALALWIVAVWLLERAQRRALALNCSFAALLVILAGSTLWAVPKIVSFQNHSGDAIFGKRTAQQKSWIDRATGGEPVSLVYSPRLDVASRQAIKPIERVSNWWDLAFWNGSIGRIYLPVAGPRALAPFPGGSEIMLSDWRTGALQRTAGDEAEYIALAESNPVFAPQPIGQSQHNAGFALYRTGSNATAAWATRGLTANGWIPPGGATLRVYAPRGATKPTALVVSAEFASPLRRPDFAGLRVTGAWEPRHNRAGANLLVVWGVRLRPGGHADFRLLRSAAPIHVSSVIVSSARDLPGSSR